jgi:phosphoribosylformimino-5-aminoimidazole carboxamide ribotide isomerase
MRIIPAIDLMDGACVRLSQGDYSKKTQYHSDPLAVAKEFEDAGLGYLHVVDLDGAKAGSPQNLNVIESIAKNTSLQVDAGGGIRTKEAIQQLLDCGVKQVNIGSLAARDPDLFIAWLEEFGPGKMILSADARDGKIAVHGWEKTTDLDLLDFLETFVEKGLQYAVVTDISRDGMLTGPAHDWYQQILAAFPGLRLVASGGVASLEDLQKLQHEGLDGAIVGKAIYEGKISLDELRRVNSEF